MKLRNNVGNEIENGKNDHRNAKEFFKIGMEV